MKETAWQEFTSLPCSLSRLYHKNITLLFAFLNTSTLHIHVSLGCATDKLSKPSPQKGSILTIQVNRSPNFAPTRRPTITSTLLPAPARPIIGTYRDVAARVRYRHCANGSAKAAMCSSNHLPPESQVKQQIFWSRHVNIQNF